MGDRAEEKPCKVLVVEDHGDSANLLSRVVWSFGFDVAVAEGHWAGLQAARADRYDVLVCDVGLPDGDGCELLREVKAMYDIRGVAVTGHGYPDDRRRCADAGFEAFLLKPISIGDLETAIRRVTAELPCDPASAPRGRG
jgi:two-component system CheB/CheR fusion protein